MPEYGPITIVIQEVHQGGGQERVTYEVARRLLEHGAELTVIARRCELPASERLRWVRVPGPARPFTLAYIWFFLLGTIATAFYGRGFRQSAGAIVSNRMDAAIIHFSHLGYSNRPTAEQRSHDSFLHKLNAYLSSVLSRLAERLCYRPSRVGTLVALSAGAARELRACFPRMASRVTVIPNGVDLDRFRPDPEARARLRAELGIDEDDPVAVFVGGDWDRKGLPIAVAGIAATPRWHLLVAGGGDEDALRELARSKNVDHRLHLYGRTPRPEEVWAAGDVLLFPTAYEGFSLVTLEAAAAGLPLLMTKVNGSEELVVEGETGLLIDRTPESIHGALEVLGDDLRLRERMGENARRTALKYNWEDVTRKYESLYAGEDHPR